MNFERISDDLDLLGLTDFEKTVWSLAQAWFSEDEVIYPNDSIRKFGEYIIDCGAFGNSDKGQTLQGDIANETQSLFETTSSEVCSFCASSNLENFLQSILRIPSKFISAKCNI